MICFHPDSKIGRSNWPIVELNIGNVCIDTDTKEIMVVYNYDYSREEYRCYIIRKTNHNYSRKTNIAIFKEFSGSAFALEKLC